MKLRNRFSIMPGAFALIFLLSNCSDDEGVTPPVVDCNATGPSISLSTTTTNCGEDDGSIEINITGGTGVLDVTLDPQPLDFNFANNTFTDLEPGTYTIEVTDADQCATSETIEVGIAGGGVSYINDVDPIVQTNCAVPNCHDGSNAGLPNFTDFSQLQSRANNQPGGVRQRVKTGDMPRSGSLDAAEIATLLCWIDEGAQDN
ncbi:MAG: hypothetical protein DHS20C17_35270 [Cyclobacteriaceae bacterium]|nr:MAG: hypothetical protein DHS20C17_35270 [Cyclobacteriaceae bacterium]